ncbi:TonB-dependent receptor [Flavobacteriales bacterium]|nr:TonB-dependent receptor [Flavobacteriales bacterium]
MFNNKSCVFIVFTLLSLGSYSQECNSVVSGFVKDLSTDKPISFANVYLTETQTGVYTDSLGFFKFESVCPGEIHVSISHIGCELQKLFFTTTKDTLLNVFMDHNSHLVNEFLVEGEGGKFTTQETQSINSKTIGENSNKNLATMLEKISGVSVIKNGSGISKPVVHGLYGTRITILNNGVAQSGQQWGVDHSPEIDPLVANRITVIKGVGALEYQGSSLGSVILIEPNKINNEPHLHGEARYSFESNGLGNGINLDLQQYGKKLAWRIVGTLKKNGDYNTPNYYLKNTGSQQANIAIQLEKKWNKKWASDLYFSSFNADIGVLRGSHIGNLTDLEEAFEREVPFYTEDNFSYDINSPYQKVNHQLLKFHTKFQINDKQWIDYTYAGQYNLRKEFDVRRSGRSEMPALSLRQISNFIEVKYNNFLTETLNLKTGIQLNSVDNTNLPETGILPLIPDYFALEAGVFGLISKKMKKTTLEFGARYDYENREVIAISVQLPREIIRYQNDYHNISSVLGITHELHKHWQVSYNLGFASRNPEVNELYSNGLHQGVSGIEEGDPLLQAETSFKNTFSIKGNIKKKLFVEALFYHQTISNYIYLQPQDEIRLTIRGAFPVFSYEQTKALLRGFDIATTYQATDRFNITAKYSFLKGDDKTNDSPLIFMPSNNLFTEINYELPELGKLQNVGFALNGKYVFEQTNLLVSQDFVAVPEAYFLLGIKLSAEKQLKKLKLNMFLKAENLLNTTYRDYLNRQRYFANDLGFNLVAGVNVKF